MCHRVHRFNLLPVVLLCLAAGARAQQGSVATDTAALQALYDATNGADWTDDTNWGTAQALSTWHGVTTNGDGRVTRLELQENGLNGTLPTELENLTHLESLLLDRNYALMGPLPSGLRELSALATVDLTDTELCAPADADFQTWLAGISFAGLTCPPTEQSVIDVAVFYTPAARDQAGGSAAIKTQIDLMAAETNTAYEASGVNQRINLVAAEEVVGYRETHDLTIDIARLRGASDGYMDEIHDIRDTVAADIVLLIVAGSSGRAYQLSVPSTSAEWRAFGVVNAYSTNTFAHELGHIMGLRHDRYEVCGDNCDGFTQFPYAFGYVNQEALEPSPPDTAFWRTIMSYPNQCGRCSGILRFSNPDQIYPDPGGDPLGKAGLEPAPGADGPADAVRMLNRTRGYVANYRTPPAITVSFDAETYTATEDGTAATVTISLSDAPGRAIDIPFTATSTTGATAADYTVPGSVAFAATETQQTFTVTAVDDAVDDDAESVTLTLGALLPGGVSAGSPATTTVTLTDNDTVTGAPSILSVSLTSDPGGGYAAGEEIEATVRFNKTVTVTGTPQLGLTVGSDTQQASYAGGAREVVTFSYAVAADETDEDGVSIAANALSLNGGTIRDGANQTAVLTHSALADDAHHRVDGVAPVLQTAVVDETTLTLTYNEPLAQPAPRASAFFTVAVIHPSSGTHAPSVVVDGSVMTVTLWEPVLAGEMVTVKFSNISVFGTPHLIRDLAGNPAASLRRHAVTNVTEERPYDTDGDGLIEITTLAQLDAFRHDLNGDGVPTAGGASAYRAAFPDAFVEVGAQLRCVLECRGYELMADLDFDTDDDGDVDSDDYYWNNGAGWNPMGRSGAELLTTFEGNGHTIRNLFINRPSTNHAGLFGYTDWKAALRNVGLIQVDVAGRTHVGGLVGNNLGTITACYATGHVSGSTNIGGLVGTHYSSVRTSYATARVSGRSAVGGLVGRNLGIIIAASYATGAVAGQSSVGGLIGYEDGNTVRASYATGPVSGNRDVGGLVGLSSSGEISASYWDTTTSGQTTGDHGTGQTTAQLQAPTDATGIYADWDAAQWDFGGTDAYPALAVDFDGDGDATWAEFGYQLREGPTLTATFESGGVILSWTAVDTDHWDPEPEVAYTLYREAGTTITTLAENSSGRSYTDSSAVVGETYTYQVAAVINGGEGSRSGRVSVLVPKPDDMTDPTINKLEITSDPGSDVTYALGDVIEVTVTFSENVVVAGTPQLTLTVGDEDRTADYDSVTDAETLFLYKVVTGDVDTNGVSIAVDSLSLNGGQIKDGSDNQANLEHRALGNQSRHRVDGIKPKLASTGGAVVNGSTLTLTYNETLDSSSTPPASAFFVFGGASSLTISGVGVRGSGVELRLNPAVEHGETGIQVTYTVPVEVGATPIQDRAGNEAEGLSGEAVTNVTPSPPPGGGGPPPVPNPVPSAPRNLEALGGDEQVTLSWEAPEDDGGFPVTDYEYLISRSGRGWISTESTDLTHTVTELVNGRVYVFQVRAVSGAGAGSSSHQVEVTPGVGRLEFAHFANGSSITSDLVLVNVFARPIRPWLYFYDREGERIAVESVVELTEELEVAQDGSLTVQSEMQPLEALTISTHGQGVVVAGSVTVLSNGPIGGVLRFDLPGVGVAGVGAGQPLRDALFPARRQAGGISTAVAIRNLEAEELVVSCRLMQEGAVLEEVEIELQANGQDGRFIEEVFTTTDTSNFSGLVRCRAEGEFTGVAVELDAGQGIFTTLPVLPVDRTVFRGGEYTLGFAHFANGASITSDLVLVNVSIRPSRPAGPYTTPIPPTRPSFYFYDRAGERLAAQSVVEVTAELEVAEDGGLTIQSELEPLQAVTISTHGRGEVVAGSVRVVAEGPLGGVLRFDLPGVGVAGVGAGQPLTDALFPARRQQGGISTAAAIRNLETEELVVNCQLMQEGAVLEEVDIELEVNGQDGRFIEEVFTRTDTSDFVGLVRCTAEGEFTGVAVELDAGNGIFTTLPVVPVPGRTSRE